MAFEAAYEQKKNNNNNKRVSLVRVYLARLFISHWN